MILITGATGQLGNLTLMEILKLKPATDIAVLARKPSVKTHQISALGVDVRFGDYADKDSLLQAFRGIDTLFFVSTHEAAQDISVHMNVVESAKQNDVRRIVYTSTQGEKTIENTDAINTADMHALTERAIVQSGIDYTILRNAPYMESLPMILGEAVLKDGYSMPMGEGKISYATRHDMAIGAAKVLSSGIHANQTYEFGGNVSVGFSEILETLSRLTGNKLEYHSIEPEEYEALSKKAGIPEMYIQANLGFANQVRSGYFDHPTQDLENILERKPTTVEMYLKEFYKG